MDLPVIAQAILAALGVSLLSLFGLAIAPKKWNHSLEQRMIGFAAGVLLATAALQLLPEAAEHSGLDGYLAFLIGIIGFFILERLIGGLHSHKTEAKSHKTSGYFVVVGDGVHNFIDGVAIAVAFQVNPALGIATTLAVAAHEIPQEIADFVVLRKAGFSRNRALLVNFASAITAVAGVALTFMFGNFIESYEGIALGVTAGIFLYIAAVDMIPELQHSHEGGDKYALPLLIGALLIFIITIKFPHEELQDSHQDETVSALISTHGE